MCFEAHFQTHVDPLDSTTNEMGFFFGYDDDDGGGEGCYAVFD